ncbi:inosine-5-monophosphate dehydrogenase [Labrys miyagiensis]|uniref:Inosine-5-monophosphate dehydrogenase n=1 Tax=Labrys miyagiensis TaxID=346912 RepID=A0ABQ6CE90_9HYPH|nr:CBS domain-containing protein [Labrys miyagiensis]GLS18686.1 inosine-5-monophosphate dehydrogenase [Labrys miyagiensis]
MTVAHILRGKSREIFTLSPDHTIAEAARTLAEKRIGAVLITKKDGSIAGILSERDIVRALAKNAAEGFEHKVKVHMTAKVETVRESDTIPSIMERMTTGKFRHMPVVENGKLIGIVSIGDVVKFRLAEMEAETQAMRDYITA